MKEHRSVVGSLINFRGLVYSPVNEQGVVFLFGRILEDLNPKHARAVAFPKPTERELAQDYFQRYTPSQIQYGHILSQSYLDISPAHKL